MDNFTIRWGAYCKHHPLKQAETFYSRARYYLSWCHDKWRQFEMENGMESFGDTPREKGETQTSLASEFKKRDNLFNNWIVKQKVKKV